MKKNTTNEANRFIFGSTDAARFLGVKLETVKYHLYTSKKLVPDGTIGQDGRTIFFYRPTLEDFRDRKLDQEPQARLYQYEPGRGISQVT